MKYFLKWTPQNNECRGMTERLCRNYTDFRPILSPEYHMNFWLQSRHLSVTQGGSYARQAP
jgi:hypothetical protein